MSFCCGASMVGTTGTLKHIRTYIHNVPLLFCPVCHRVQVHYSVENEYELLADYAHGDDASEVDFKEYVDIQAQSELYENCVSHEGEEPLVIVHNQIDMALDLMRFAKSIEDQAWVDQLKKRLVKLSQRRSKLKKKAMDGNRSTS